MVLKKKHDKSRSGIPRKDRIGRQRFEEDATEEKERLSRKQKAELEEFNLTEEEVASELGKLDLQSTAKQPEQPANGSGATKESKAARRRRKKAEQEAESQKRIEKERREMGPSAKSVELRLINQQIESKGLIICPIAADGHCLYSAIVHQIKQNRYNDHSWPIDLDVQSLRNATAQYLMQNKAEFMPFIESVQNDDQKFAQYCEELRNTAVWGGHVELQIISKVLLAAIEVYSAESPVLSIDDGIGDSATPVLRLSFHRQYLGLGEHYNSVVPRTSP